MAGGFYRGQAMAKNIWLQDLQDYLKGLGGGEFQDVINMLTETQEPYLTDLVGDVFTRLSGEGQIQPGAGASSQGQKYFQKTISDYLAGKIVTPALQAYQYAYQPRFGTSSQDIASQYQSSRGAGVEDILAGLAGTMAGAGASGFGGGVGKWAATLIT